MAKPVDRDAYKEMLNGWLIRTQLALQMDAEADRDGTPRQDEMIADALDGLTDFISAWRRYYGPRQITEGKNGNGKR